MISVPVNCSITLMFRPSRPMMRPFISSLGRSTAVVVISGGAPNAPLTYTAPLAATFGANIVIYKPFEKAELLKAIDSVLAD